jgi:ABC-type nickel/cobalt efflux system permease component RcnA
MATIWRGICWVVGVVDHWQTLVTGIIALVGAWWTVRGIRSQIKQTIEFERDQHEREERAARSVLPMALSEIAQYAIDCIKLLKPYVFRDSSDGRSATRADGRLT